MHTSIRSAICTAALCSCPAVFAQLGDALEGQYLQVLNYAEVVMQNDRPSVSDCKIRLERSNAGPKAPGLGYQCSQDSMSGVLPYTFSFFDIEAGAVVSLWSKADDICNFLRNSVLAALEGTKQPPVSVENCKLSK